MMKEMTFRKAIREENKERYWQDKSKQLFKKYSQLKLFRFSTIHDSITCLDPHTGETHTYYCTAKNRQAYRDLKAILDLEIKICYKK